ncbi:hypothetical protein KSP40_PGU022778 [Platanthera guangdongensis]|uniref:Uncharacterized protein n=1 Tax=Platanthera guangdongensis TaxID=2320717 RepID=A0ABR2MG56_9ASPA
MIRYVSSKDNLIVPMNLLRVAGIQIAELLLQGWMNRNSWLDELEQLLEVSEGLLGGRRLAGGCGGLEKADSRLG